MIGTTNVVPLNCTNPHNKHRFSINIMIITYIDIYVPSKLFKTMEHINMNAAFSLFDFNMYFYQTQLCVL